MQDTSSNLPKGGPLWRSVKSVLDKAIEKMLPFFKGFGVEKGKVLSSFATAIQTPDELKQLLVSYCQPAKHDLWGMANNWQ